MKFCELRIEMKYDDAALGTIVPLRLTHTFVEQ
jgi:hypothetical protein